MPSSNAIYFDVGMSIKLFCLSFICVVNNTGMDLDIELNYIQPANREQSTHVKMYASPKPPHQRIPLVVNPSHISVFAINLDGERTKLVNNLPIYRGHKLIFKHCA